MHARTALMNHTHSSPNRGSRGASARAETGVEEGRYSRRLNNYSSYIVANSNRIDDHMGVCSSVFKMKENKET